MNGTARTSSTRSSLKGSSPRDGCRAVGGELPGPSGLYGAGRLAVRGQSRGTKGLKAEPARISSVPEGSCARSRRGTRSVVRWGTSERLCPRFRPTVNIAATVILLTAAGRAGAWRRLRAISQKPSAAGAQRRLRATGQRSGAALSGGFARPARDLARRSAKASRDQPETWRSAQRKLRAISQRPSTARKTSTARLNTRGSRRSCTMRPSQKPTSATRVSRRVGPTSDAERSP